MEDLETKIAHLKQENESLYRLLDSYKEALGIAIKQIREIKEEINDLRRLG